MFYHFTAFKGRFRKVLQLLKNMGMIESDVIRHKDPFLMGSFTNLFFRIR